MEEKSCLTPHLYTTLYAAKYAARVSWLTYHANLPLAKTPYIPATSLYRPQTAVKKAPSSHKEDQSEAACRAVTETANITSPHVQPTKTYILPFKITISSLYKVEVFSLFKFPLTLQLRPNSSYYSSKAPAQALMYLRMRWRDS